MCTSSLVIVFWGLFLGWVVVWGLFGCCCGCGSVFSIWLWPVSSSDYGFESEKSNIKLVFSFLQNNSLLRDTQTILSFQALCGLSIGRKARRFAENREIFCFRLVF